MHFLLGILIQKHFKTIVLHKDSSNLNELRNQLERLFEKRRFSDLTVRYPDSLV